MSELIFVTSNPHKADYVARHLGIPVRHHALELPEIQSLDLQAITAAKAQAAFERVGQPVLIEDVALTIETLGALPGPFIKWFEQEIGLERLCRLADADTKRQAQAAIDYAYHDGERIHHLGNVIAGTIAQEPRGENGFGWDRIFIHEGMAQTRAELSKPELEHHSMRREPLQQLRRLLSKNRVT